MQNYQCRNCGHQEIQKISAIHSAGSWSSVSFSGTETTGYSSSGTQYNASSHGSGINMGSTRLAARLQPPATPKEMYCGYLEAAISRWFFSKSGSRAEGHLLDVVSQARVVRWQQQYAIWDRLWYCARCDYICDPTEGSACPSDRMQQLMDSVEPEIVNNEYPPGMCVATPYGVGVVTRPNLDPLGLKDTSRRIVLIVPTSKHLRQPRLFNIDQVFVSLDELLEISIDISIEEADALVKKMKQEQAGSIHKLK